MIQARSSLSLRASLFTGVVVGLVLVLAAWGNFFASLERLSLDYRFALRGRQTPAAEILIVGITAQCLEELGRWPWDREVHARLLDRLVGGEAAVIALDFLFSEPAREAEDDLKLAAAGARARALVYALDAPPVVRDRPGVLAAPSVVASLPLLQEEAAAGFINVIPDPDGILRRFIVWMDHGGQPLYSFALQSWTLWHDEDRSRLDEDLLGQFREGARRVEIGGSSYPLDPGGRTLINYSGGPQNFSLLPYHLVLAGAYDPAVFRDKIVLVGYYAPGLGDYFYTPLARDEPMYGLEVHANVLHTLLKGEALEELPLSASLVLVFLAGVLMAPLYRLLHPLWGLALLLFFSSLFFGLAVLLFSRFSLYVECVYPLLALAGTYFGVLGQRFLIEQRDRQRVTRLFGRYVAPQVVEEILRLGEENLHLGGIKQEVTVLFIDIRGFTSLAERLPPEEVVAILNEYFSIVTRGIFRYGGTLDKFMGDAAMAIFNAPLPRENHHLCALRAAGAIMAEGGVLRERVRERYGVAMHFGVGVNSGEAVVGNIGGAMRMEYTAIGDTVNLAARLESLAAPGQILVGDEVWARAKGAAPLEALGAVKIKGKSKSVQVYRLTAWQWR